MKATIKKAFPAVVDDQSCILILGSMPGEASLQAGQYYAHPRNAFWPILCVLLNLPTEISYSERLNALKKSGIALWDVAAACERAGSLDTAINHSTLVANDFTAFFKCYPGIKQVYCNGQSVAALFKRHVLMKQDVQNFPDIETLPSTSPANARLSFSEKLQKWKVALKHL